MSSARDAADALEQGNEFGDDLCWLVQCRNEPTECDIGQFDVVRPFSQLAGMLDGCGQHESGQTLASELGCLAKCLLLVRREAEVETSGQRVGHVRILDVRFA